MNSKSILCVSLAAVAALWVLPTSARGQIFVSNLGSPGPGNGTVSEYSLTGGTLNANLITGLTNPGYLAVSGGDIFLADQFNDRISEYTTSGTLVNANLITGLTDPVGIAVSGGNIFVANDANSGSVGEYTLAGAPVNASLITGLSDPLGLAVSGSSLFVGNGANIGEYTTGGAPIATSLITGEPAQGLAVSGGNLFVSVFGSGNNDGRLDEYTTAGAFVQTAASNLNNGYDVAAVGGSVYFAYLQTGFHTDGWIGNYPGNATLIDDDNHPFGVAIAMAPEPSTWAMLAIGASALLLAAGRDRRARKRHD